MREVNVRASFRNGRPVRGHVRRIGQDHSDKRVNHHPNTRHLASLVSDRGGVRAINDAAFKIFLEESIRSSDRVASKPYIVQAPNSTVWVDAANSEWRDIPQESGFAQERRELVGDVLDALAQELCTVSERDGRTIEVKDVREMSDAELDTIVSRVKYEVYPPVPTSSTHNAERRAEKDQDVHETIMEAIYMIRHNRPGARSDLKYIFHDQREQGGKNSTTRTKQDSHLFTEVCESSHNMWRGRRLGEKGQTYPEPLVFESEYGYLVDVHDPKNTVSNKIEEELAVGISRELSIARHALKDAGMLQGRKAVEKAAEEIYMVDLTLQDTAPGRSSYPRFDMLSKREKKNYRMRAKERIKQVRKFKLKAK